MRCLIVEYLDVTLFKVLISFTFNFIFKIESVSSIIVIMMCYTHYYLFYCIPVTSLVGYIYNAVIDFLFIIFKLKS